MHLYIQPIGHLIILRKKKITLLDLAIVKTILKFTMTETSSVKRHTDLHTFICLEEFLELQREHFRINFFFCFIYIVSCHIYKEQMSNKAKTDNNKKKKNNHKQSQGLEAENDQDFIH